MNKSAHSIHTLTYHLIFCTKYRRTVLTRQIGDRVKEICQDIANEHKFTIVAIETDTDHAHDIWN
jgi:putative transposase